MSTPENEPNKEPDRIYECIRKGAMVLVTSLSASGLNVPVAGAVKHPDGTIIIEPLSPVPTYVLRETLDEIERVLGPIDVMKLKPQEGGDA